VRELRVRLLGGLEVDGLTARDVGSRKGRTLLAALALARGRPLTTDRLVDIVWADRPPARPGDQLGILVSRLRGVVGSSRLVRAGQGYALAADWLDLAEVEARVEEAASRLTTAPVAARAAAAAALVLVRGPLLPDEEGEWVEAERAAVDRLVAQANLLGAEAALLAGDPVTAGSRAAKALDADPYDEAALRALMRAHVAAGRPASALHAYAAVRERLLDELGTSPDAATEELHSAILRGELRTASPARPGIVGRDREVAWLDHQLDRVRSGTGRLVVVEGEAGIGKTTLVRSWSAGLEDAFVMTAACDELGRDLPLQPVLGGLDAHLAGLSAGEVDEILGPERPLVAPLLVGARPSPSAPAARPTDRPDVAGQRAALFAGLLAIVERAAAGRPVVLVVDDIHLADPVTVAWLRDATRRGRHVLAVTTRRVGAGPADDRSADAVLLLGPLDMDAAGELVGAERASRLHRRSRGHPLFLLALADADEEAVGLPATVTEAVERQVAAMGDAARTLVAAAVLGPAIDVALLADVLGRPPAALLDDLEAATRARILVERAEGFGFAHELVRDALDQSASAARRALLHREAARVLAGRPQAEPLTVAHHARRGGDTGLAAQALVDAAARAAERADYQGAVAFLDDALQLTDDVTIRLGRARARLAVGDLEGAASDAAHAIADGAGVAGFELAGWISYYRRDFDAALRYAEEGAARGDDPGLRASCLTLAGRALHSTGDLAGADQRLTDAADIAPASLRPLVVIWLGDLRVFQARWREAADQVERGLLDRSQLRHPFALPHALMTRLRAAALGGDVELALQLSADAVAEMQRRGELGARYLPGTLNYRAWIVRQLGRSAEADELNEEARALTPAAGTEEPFNQGTLDLVDGRLLAGDLAGAEAHLAELRGLSDGDGAEPAMAWHQRERAALLRSRLALARGDDESARSLASTLALEAEARGSLRHARFARVVEAMSLAAAGEPPGLGALDALLAEVEGVAGLEAWRLSADLARYLPPDPAAAISAGAQRRASRLLAATPPADRPALESWVSRVLGD